MAQAEFFLRLIIAGVCGGIIGYERTNRGKGAGIRTHIIVAIASALMMLVSKYGFTDLAFGRYGFTDLASGSDFFKLDPSRVAASIVSGVGFLGAGTIFIQKQSVKGLTTAAGIWATSGIGMAIGSGMYVIGVLASMVILTVQVIFHKNLKFLHMPNEETISFVIADSEEAVGYLKNYLTETGIQINSMSFHELPDTRLEISVEASVPHDFDVSSLLCVNRDYVKSVKV